ncbi:MAG TPA: FAD-dependent oxidoreductase [Rhizomicrobium sp.]|jgi:glycine/D-amino acid oxidase-like deaminating enzyme|nr:FAD-dependent oxidoreductase [Rhizomicrobium sp.]
MRKSQSATDEKRLVSGNPVWAHSGGAHVPMRRLRDSIKVDVAIVGAGISGAFLAHALAGRYERIAVLDRRTPAHGSTAASTALLQFEIDTPLTELRDRIGPKAARAWQRSYRATQDLVEIVRTEAIRCGLERRQSLYLAGDSMGFRGLRSEIKARHRAGLPGEYLDAAALRAQFGIDRTGAILSPGSAIANPVQLAAGLLRRAAQAGVAIYSPVRIEDILATRHGVMLDTGEHFIEARQCVLCTGYELMKGLPRKGTKITSSWAIATRPRAHYPRWLDETLVWEAADPYLYMRTTPDGRLVIGGEDEDIDLASYRARSLDRKAARLAVKARKLIPGLDFSISHRWTGAFGESDDGLPIIDRVPRMPNCFAVMGFGGNGTIYSVIASQIVPTLLKGEPDKDADIFRFR